jgi:hypothetical protein
MSFGPEGGTGHIAVYLPTRSRSPWKIDTEADWITVPGAGEWRIGFDGIDFHFTVAPNPSSTARTGTLTSCGSDLKVTQAGR